MYVYLYFVQICCLIQRSGWISQWNVLSAAMCTWKNLLIQLFQPLQKSICLLTFYFSFFILSYFVNLTSLMPSHTEQCFYYKNYTSLLKKAFNIQISITNSFKNLKAKRQSNWISDNDITWLQNFDVVFVTKLLQKITMLSVVIAVTYGYI